MNLDEHQKKTVTAWIADGLKLSEIQKRISTEFGLSLTYMDVRLLVDDLRLMPKDPPPPVEKSPAPGLPSAASSAAPPSGNPGSRSAPPGTTPGSSAVPAGNAKVSITVDAIARAGAVVSGSVSFSDGQAAAWYLDQLGRMGVAPKQTGYKPSPADMQAFQLMLEQELSKLGY
jgi:hypothetical protein